MLHPFRRFNPLPLKNVNEAIALFLWAIKHIRAEQGQRYEVAGQGHKKTPGGRDRFSVHRAFLEALRRALSARPGTRRGLTCCVSYVIDATGEPSDGTPRWRLCESGGVSIQDLLQGCCHDGKWRRLSRHLLVNS